MMHDDKYLEISAMGIAEHVCSYLFLLWIKSQISLNLSVDQRASRGNHCVAIFKDRKLLLKNSMLQGKWRIHTTY